MKPVLIQDKPELAAFLGKYPHFNFYHLGDLDDFFWPNTSWYAHKKDGKIQAVILFYTGIQPPVLLAIDNHNLPQMRDLAVAVQPELPPKFYSHLSPGLEDCFLDVYQLTHHGEHYKMVLTDLTRLNDMDTAGVRQLGVQDLTELQELYTLSYPGNWFDPRMLETGQYMGIRTREQSLVSVAGVHVYSEEYRVVALGNITTLPDHRGQGLGTAVTAALCIQLLDTTATIGLNVKKDNAPAIRTYRKLGFEVVASYHEWMIELN